MSALYDVDGPGLALAKDLKAWAAEELVGLLEEIAYAEELEAGE